MELRSLIAYALIAVIVLVGAATAVVQRRRLVARRRRLRGIKDDQRQDRSGSL